MDLPKHFARDVERAKEELRIAQEALEAAERTCAEMAPWMEKVRGMSHEERTCLFQALQAVAREVVKGDYDSVEAVAEVTP